MTVAADRRRVCETCRHWVSFTHSAQPNCPVWMWTEQVCAYLHEPDADGACLYTWPLQRGEVARE
jgi:hypothetical protein